MKLSIGRILIFRVSDTEVAPAIVTNALSDTRANVTLFRDGHTPHPISDVEITEDAHLVGAASWPTKTKD